MARLPVPGSDSGTWGNLLNDFLSQSLAADGSLLNGVVSESKLATALANKINQASPVGHTHVRADVTDIGAKVVVSATAPADTTVVWVKTS